MELERGSEIGKERKCDSGDSIRQHMGSGSIGGAWIQDSGGKEIRMSFKTTEH